MTVVVVSGGRPGYDLLMCGPVTGPDGTQVLPALTSVRRQATEIALGGDLPDRPSDDTLRRVLAGLKRKWSPDPGERTDK